MRGSQFAIAAWVLLGATILGAAVSVVNRQPIVTPAWASDNCAQSCSSNSGSKP